MPRLRYKRSWDFTLFEENEDDRESASGNSWLSNAAMASQLSDAKIKSTIIALKAQITVLEAELLSRRLTSGNKSGKNWNNIGNVRKQQHEERLYYATDRGNVRTRRKGNQFQVQKIASIRKTLKKLGVVDVDALLNEWSKITERKSE